MKDLIRLYRDPDVNTPASTPPPVAEPPVQTPPGAVPLDATPKSASASVNINAPITPQAGTFTLPDAYKDKPYLKGVDSMEKVYAMLDGAQTLVGKKGVIVPAADAPQAEKDAYYEALGRPKTAAEYTPVLIGADKTDPKVLPRLQDTFHKAGLTAEQAKIVWEGSTATFQDFAKDHALAGQQADIDFDKLAADTFGADRDKVLARGKELVDANISPAVKAAALKLDNNAYVVLADILRNIDKKYISPDGAPKHKPTIGTGTPDDIRSQGKVLMEKQLKLSPMSAEYAELQRQIDGLYSGLRR